MAEGAWVPAFDSLWTSQKTARLAKELRTSNDVAGAKFLRLMSWMRDHATSGDLGPVDRATLARALGLATENLKDEVAGERGDRFYRALVSAGFLMENTRGHVKGWEDGPGKLVDRRATDRLRKEHDRPEGHPSPGDGGGITHPSPGHRGGKAQRVFVSECPKCRKDADAGTPTTTATRAMASAGIPEERPKRPNGLPLEFPRTETTETTERTEQGAPYPRPVGRTRGTAELETVGERQASALLEGATGRWRDALQALLIAGLTNANLCTWFAGTTLEGRDGWAIVRAPNSFQVEWLASTLHVFGRDGLFRVHAGPYAREAEARQAAERVNQALGVRPFVLTR